MRRLPHSLQHRPRRVPSRDDSRCRQRFAHLHCPGIFIGWFNLRPRLLCSPVIKETQRQRTMTAADIQLTRHFRLAEFLNLGRYPDNIPDAQSLTNLQYGVATILEPVRILLNAPIIINSGYRNPHVNEAVGGVANSQHLTGCAADIRCSDRSKFNVLLAHLRATGYDQLLVGNGWCHISWNPHAAPRRMYRPHYYSY